LPETTGKFPMK